MKVELSEALINVLEFLNNVPVGATDNILTEMDLSYEAWAGSVKTLNRVYDAMIGPEEDQP